jgi:hypothetical protein
MIITLYDHYMTIIWSVRLWTWKQAAARFHWLIIAVPPFQAHLFFFPNDIPSIISRYLPGWLVSYPPFSCVPHIHSSLLSSPFLINQTLPPCQPVNPYMFHEKNPSCFMRKIGASHAGPQWHVSIWKVAAAAPPPAAAPGSLRSWAPPAQTAMAVAKEGLKRWKMGCIV